MGDPAQRKGGAEPVHPPAALHPDLPRARRSGIPGARALADAKALRRDPHRFQAAVGVICGLGASGRPFAPDAFSLRLRRDR